MHNVKHIPLVHKLLLLDILFFHGNSLRYRKYSVWIIRNYRDREELFCFHLPNSSIIADFKDEDVVASIKALYE